MNLIRFGRSRPHTRVEPLHDGALLHVLRDRHAVDSLRLGSNEIHASITHADGSITDLGLSHNLMTNGGRDLVAAALGTAGPAQNTATAVSATSLTDTGESWTVDQFKGWTVIAEESTNRPVFGNIGSNSATVLTIDDWWDPDDTAAAADPAATADYIILPTCRPKFMALTENAGAPAATDTVLTGELTTGGGSRALATYAHTAGTATFTLQKAYSITATFAAIQKMGLFTASNTTAAGILMWTATFTSASVVSGDTLTVTSTITLS